MHCIGPVTQWIEELPSKQLVAGSSPARATIQKYAGQMVGFLFAVNPLAADKFTVSLIFSVFFLGKIKFFQNGIGG